MCVTCESVGLAEPTSYLLLFESMVEDGGIWIVLPRLVFGLSSS